jgi:hypothetical protein
VKPERRKTGNRIFGWPCLGLCILLSACATGPVRHEPAIQISGMVMENQTEMYLSSVSLMVPATGGFVSCGTITPGTGCSTTFPEVEYSGNPVEITWRQGGQMHTSGLFRLQVPGDLDRRQPAEVRVVITGPDTAGAIIIQRQD